MQNHFRFWRKFNFEMHSREYCLFCRLLNFLYKLKAYTISRGSSESVWKLTVNSIKTNIGPNYTQSIPFPVHSIRSIYFLPIVHASKLMLHRTKSLFFFFWKPRRNENSLSQQK
jgi:hypothetical protein